MINGTFVKDEDSKTTDDKIVQASNKKRWINVV